MITETLQTQTALPRLILAWYKKHSRPLPWRETKDPYRIWISEIMLQQTQVGTVIPYYHRFIKAFPNVQALAAAAPESVLKAWENLGYYSRARNLHAAAKIIVHEFSGRIPDTPDDIKKLPGIGDYTAGAILSIAYAKPVPALDGNVRRIFIRLLAIRHPVDTVRRQKHLHDAAAALIPARRPGDFNQALMDLGASICKPKNPDCPRCPAARLCLSRLADMQNLLPVTAKTRGIPHREAYAAMIRNEEGKQLMVQRPARGLLASLWKLPGGFAKDGDKQETLLKQRVKEELGISIRVGRQLTSVKNAYSHFRVTLHVHDGRLLQGTPKAIDCRDWRWASTADLKTLPLSKIDRLALAAA